MYLGIDIASIDGNKPVDWSAARAAGCCFAIFRGTYKTWIDPTWKLEADRARAAGVTVGAYMFPVMNLGAASVHEQVAALHKAIGPILPGDLPPTLDVEFPGGISKTGRSRSDLLSWVREAVAEIRSVFGVWPMIYTSARVWDGQDSDSLHAPATPELLECPLWLARYPFKIRIDAVKTASQVDALALPPVPVSWGAANVWIHQYQGDAINFPGFTRTVDLNRFFDLRLGCRGERVKWLQRKVHLQPDADFGPATFKALTDFQRAKNLTPDGIVGPKTFAYLSQS